MTIVKSKLQSDEDLQILDWLTPIEYGTQHSDFLHRRQPGTCQWLLDSTQYQTWLNTGKQILFCPGIPGTGKTILTSVVVDHLLTRFQSDQTVSIVYVYCSFRRKDEQKYDNLLVSLLKQLAQNQASLPKGIRDLYNRHRKKQTRPPSDEISKLIQAVAALFSRVFVVVDALDECKASDGCRENFISELFNLQNHSTTSIFATSRFVPEVTSKFDKCTILEIRANDEDVKKYLEVHMKGLPSFAQQDRQLQEEIKMVISEAADGMYVLSYNRYVKRR